jgi:hypothetical protein
MTYDDELRKVAADAMLALFNNGSLRFLTSGDSPLATLGFSATAFPAASTASPSVSTSNAITPDGSPTPGTFTKVQLRKSDAAVRVTASVGTSGAELIVTSNVLPSNVDSVSMPGGLTVSFDLA